MNRLTFDLFEHRILTHYAAARKILDGETPAPRMAIVYPSYRCNQNCLGCEYSDDVRDLRNLMDSDRLLGLIGALAGIGVEALEFCGGGEPSLHPDLPAAIRAASGLGVRTGLLTNGTMLKGDLRDALLTHASYVRAGIDAATNETYRQVKRPGPEAGFPVVVDNLRGMVQERNRTGSRLRVSLKFLLSRRNLHEVEPAVALAAELGVDSIQFKALRNHSEELSDAEKEEVTGRIRALAARTPATAVVGSAVRKTIDSRCWLTPLHLVVDALGDVYLCCYFRHRKPTHRIGNAFETPLEQIWSGPTHREAIRGIVPTECNHFDCRFIQYNRLLDAAVREDDGQLSFL